MGAVEDDDRRLDLGHDRAQAVARPEGPAQVGAGSRAGRTKRCTRRGSPGRGPPARRRRSVTKSGSTAVEAPRDRQRAGQVSEPGAVRRDEQDTSARCPMLRLRPRSTVGPLVRAAQERRAGHPVAPRAGRGRLGSATSRSALAALREAAAPRASRFAPAGLICRRMKRCRRLSGADAGEARQRPTARLRSRGSRNRPARARGTGLARSPSRRRRSLGSAPPTTRVPWAAGARVDQPFVCATRDAEASRPSRTMWTNRASGNSSTSVGACAITSQLCSTIPAAGGLGLRLGPEQVEEQPPAGGSAVGVEAVVELGERRVEAIARDEAVEPRGPVVWKPLHQKPRIRRMKLAFETSPARSPGNPSSSVWNRHSTGISARCGEFPQRAATRCACRCGRCRRRTGSAAGRARTPCARPGGRRSGPAWRASRRKVRRPPGSTIRRRVRPGARLSSPRVHRWLRPLRHARDRPDRGRRPALSPGRDRGPLPRREGRPAGRPGRTPSSRSSSSRTAGRSSGCAASSARRACTG